MATSAERLRVGALIRERRQALGLKQPEFARLVGVSRNTVSSWEQGHKYPARHVGKIKAVLQPFSFNGAVTVYPDLADPAEALVWRMTRYSEEERREFLLDLRARRRAAASTG